jgi:hypothetical protein
VTCRCAVSSSRSAASVAETKHVQIHYRMDSMEIVANM